MGHGRTVLIGRMALIYARCPGNKFAFGRVTLIPDNVEYITARCKRRKLTLADLQWDRGWGPGREGRPLWRPLKFLWRS